MVVLDVDGVAGRASLQVLEKRHGALPTTLTARSGRPDGGEHRYFSYAADDIRNSTGRVGIGLDVRGTGGYIIAPPSIHESGAPYAWARGFSIAPLPHWWRDLTLQPPTPSSRRSVSIAAGDSLAKRARIYIAHADAVGRGARNDRLFNLAGHVASLVDEFGGRLDESAIIDLLQDFNRRCDPPLDQVELANAVRSALKNGTPRDLKLHLSNVQYRINKGLALRGRDVCDGH